MRKLVSELHSEETEPPPPGIEEASGANPSDGIVNDSDDAESLEESHCPDFCPEPE